MGCGFKEGLIIEPRGAGEVVLAGQLGVAAPGHPALLPGRD